MGRNPLEPTTHGSWMRILLMSQARKAVTILGLAFVGWAACAAIVGIGMVVTSQMNALIAHAVGAPIIFACISVLNFRRFRHTTPIRTALIFLTFVFLMDFFVVAFVIMRSFQMFSSLLGTWIPFVLIFLSTYVTGVCATRSR